jgi:tetratricopeptide (TPR) repeat protein
MVLRAIVDSHPRAVIRVVVTALIVLCAGAVLAQEANPAPMQQQISLTAAAALLIQANRIDDAERTLALALQQNPNDNEAIFLRGMIAVARKNYDAAIEDFRRILAAEPNRERVRLELARAFFLQSDYENAERNFRFARAGDLPDDAKANID